MFTIEYATGVVDDFARLRAYFDNVTFAIYGSLRLHTAICGGLLTRPYLGDMLLNSVRSLHMVGKPDQDDRTDV